jgi:hypothetical protein
VHIKEMDKAIKRQSKVISSKYLNTQLPPEHPSDLRGYGQNLAGFFFVFHSGAYHLIGKVYF